MNRNLFVLTFLLAVVTLAPAQAQPAKPAPTKAVYELRTYAMRFGASAAPFENYLKDALIPGLNRLGINAGGVFREMGKSDPANVYVLIPYSSMAAYTTAAAQLAADAAYAQVSQPYMALAREQSPFTRYTTSLMNAFDVLPQVVVPGKSSRIFELRTYEGYSEDAVRRKVKMFNNEEMPIFYKTKLNPVFFGEVIAGEHMPCLTYMLTFKDMAERDANWKQFIDEPEWKRISALPEYANSVSNIIRIFLEPTPYSQL